MILLLIPVLLSYIVLVIVFYERWHSIPTYQPTILDQKYNDHPYVSIIIPVKNEAKNLNSVINDLEYQSFPSHKFEILFINDHSTDHTVEIIQNMISNTTQSIHLHNLTNTYSKKAAIQKGIDVANGEIIVCSDGDCHFDKDWLAAISSYMYTTQAKLIFGPVTFFNNRPHGFFQNLFYQMQVIEFASLVGSGAASLKGGFPNMCNGANIAYRKEVFFEVNGFQGNEHIHSGDDEFLMHKVYQKYPDQVHFIKSRQAIVQTNACNTLTQFYKQRKRWAGKWEHYSNRKVQLMGAFIFLINGLHLFLIILAAILPNHFFLVTLSFTILRGTTEYIFINSVLRFLNKKLYLIPYIVLVSLYPFYVVFFALTGRVRK